MLLVDQIALGCSVKDRKSGPCLLWISAGTIHHAEASGREEGRAPGEGERVGAPPPEHHDLVEEERGGRQRDPEDRGRVRTPAAGRDGERERRRPAPRARLPQASVCREEDPRQGGVGEQGRGRAVGLHDDVGIGQVEDGGDQMNRAAPAAVERVDEQHRPPAREPEQRRQPDPFRDPGRNAERVRPGEIRPHREQVADELTALDVAEVQGRAPHGGDAVQEKPRVDRQLDPRVACTFARDAARRRGRATGPRDPTGAPCRTREDGGASPWGGLS